jgi:hypothetical protein
MFEMFKGDTDSGASAAAPTESLVWDCSTADGPAKRPAPGSSGLSVEPSPRPSKAHKQDAVLTSSAGCEASEAPHDGGKLGVVCVDRALTPRSHCGWCDTVIEQGAPRVEKRQFHAAGRYSRNNGETEGYTHGGVLRLYLHPQCAWAAVLAKRDTTCSGCATVVKKDTWLFTTRLGTPPQPERRPPHPAQRCKMSTSGNLWQCVGCVKAFVDLHQDLLSGHICATTQFDMTVAWELQASQKGVWGQEPMRAGVPSDKVGKERLRNVFASLAGGEMVAVERHDALQKVIKRALATDKDRANKERGLSRYDRVSAATHLVPLCPFGRRA